MVPRILALLILAAGAAALTLLPPGTGRNVKLNEPLALAPEGDVTGYRLTPDGSRAVFLAEVGGGVQLLSVPTDGSSPQAELVPGLVAGGAVTEFLLTSDGTRAVYRADPQGDQAFELFSVPVDASAPPTLLSGALQPDGDVRPGLALSPDGTLVVYRADAITDQVNELFRVPVDAGAAPVRLNGGLASGIQVQPELEISPDGTQVVYRTADGTGLTSDLHRAFSSGSPAPIQLSTTGSFDSLRITADSTRVVFLSFRDTPGVRELFSVPLDGSEAATKLNDDPVAGGDVLEFDVGPNGLDAVYLADQDTDAVFELFSVPADGSSTPTKLNGPFGAGNVSVLGFEIVPTGGQVAYLASMDMLIRNALFSVPLDGSAAPIQLTGSQVQTDFRVSADGSRVVFRQWTGADHQLYSVPLDGSAAQDEISTPIPAGKTVLEFLLAPSGDRVAYQIGFGGYELYSAPVDASSAPVQLVPFPAGFVSSAVELQFTLDGALLVYRADQESNDLVELFSVPADASRAAAKLSASLTFAPTGRVNLFEITPDGRRAVYTASGDTPGVSELYSAPVDGSAPQIRISAPLLPPDGVLDFTLSPDSAWVVYRRFDGTAIANELFSVPVDGSQSAVRLNPPLPPGGSAGQGASFSTPQYGISPDSTRVVYLGDQETDNVFEIFSVPIDGSSSSVKLNGPLVAGGQVAGGSLVNPGFEIAADSSRVVYLADQDTDDVFQLYSVPLAGGQAPLVISGPLVVQGDVSDFTLSPDSTLAVYAADQLVDQQVELFAAPVDGSASAVRLSGTLVPEGDVFTSGGNRFTIARDSSRVVYMADGRINDVLELFSAPLDASEPPARLSGAFPAGGDTIDFRVSPDSRWVAYLADQEVNEVNELFGARIDGSLPAVKLSTTPAPNGDVRSYRISPDSRYVVYNADQDTNTWWALFRAPIDGAQPAVKIDGTQFLSRDVEPNFEIGPDSGYAVYMADEITNGILELMAVPLGEGFEGASVRVNEELVAGGGIHPFTLDPFDVVSDSSRVVYSADQDLAGIFELYSTLMVPLATTLTPDQGSVRGGNTVTIQGCGFEPGTEVFFGGRPATSVTFVSSSELRAVVPANFRIPPPTKGPGAGKLRRAVIENLVVDVSVSTNGFRSTLPGGYTYVPRL